MRPTCHHLEGKGDEPVGYKVYGMVKCSCTAVLRLPLPDGTASPAYFKTWCAECGKTLEGRVEVEIPRVDSGPSPGTTGSARPPGRGAEVPRR